MEFFFYFYSPPVARLSLALGLRGWPLPPAQDLRGQQEPAFGTRANASTTPAD